MKSELHNKLEKEPRDKEKKEGRPGGGGLLAGWESKEVKPFSDMYRKIYSIGSI